MCVCVCFPWRVVKSKYAMCGFGTQCVYVYMVAHHCLEAAIIISPRWEVFGEVGQLWWNGAQTSSKTRKFEIKRLEKKM